MFQDDLLELIFGKHIQVFGLDFEVHLYGLFIAIGILLCIYVLYKFTEKKGMPTAMQDYCFFIGILAILIGFFFSNLFQAFYNWVDNGFKNFSLKEAGITAMGGFAGGAVSYIALYFLIGTFYFRGENKGMHVQQFNKILTVAPLCVLIAHAFGRIGCLMAGCCHGAYLGQEYVFGGIWMDVSTYDTSLLRYVGGGYYVPTQLYESLFLFGWFALLSYLYLKKDCNITVQLYFIGYGIWRFIIEYFRTDDRGGFVLGLSPSQWFSIVFIVCGVGLLLFYKFKKIPWTIHYEKLKKANENQSCDVSHDETIKSEISTSVDDNSEKVEEKDNKKE